MTLDRIPPATPSPLTILVVDDIRHDRLLLTRFIERMGHRPVVAGSGYDAIKAAAAARPDLVIVARSMTHGDDGVFLDYLNGESGHRRAVIVLMAADATEAALIQALNEGAHDWLHKPLQFSLLAAKINGLARLLGQARLLEEQVRALSRERTRTLQEAQDAAAVIAALRGRSGPADPAVQHWMQATGESCAGHVVLAARTPSGDLHVLLANAAGRGLPAALCTLPVIGPFYAMTAKDLPMAGIVAEINDKVHGQQLTRNIVAACAIAVNVREQTLAVWNGGMPAVSVVDAAGRERFRMESRHPPLGVAAAAVFSTGMDVYCYEDACQLIAVASGGGALPGDGELRELLAEHPFDRRMDALQSRVAAQPDATGPAEDISVLFIDCIPQAQQTARAAPVSAPAEPRRVPAGLGLSAHDMGYVEAVPQLLEMIAGTGCGARYSAPMFVFVSEFCHLALELGLLPLHEAGIGLQLAFEDHDGVPAACLTVSDHGAGPGYARLIAAIAPPGRGHAAAEGPLRNAQISRADGHVLIRLALRVDGPGGDALVALAPGHGGAG